MSAASYPLSWFPESQAAAASALACAACRKVPRRPFFCGCPSFHLLCTECLPKAQKSEEKETSQQTQKEKALAPQVCPVSGEPTQEERCWQAKAVARAMEAVLIARCPRCASDVPLPLLEAHTGQCTKQGAHVTTGSFDTRFFGAFSENGDRKGALFGAPREDRVDSWSVEAVSAWLEGMGLSDYERYFTDARVDGPALLALAHDKERLQAQLRVRDKDVERILRDVRHLEARNEARKEIEKLRQEVEEQRRKVKSLENSSQRQASDRMNGRAMKPTSHRHSYQAHSAQKKWGAGAATALAVTEHMLEGMEDAEEAMLRDNARPQRQHAQARDGRQARQARQQRNDRALSNVHHHASHRLQFHSERDRDSAHRRQRSLDMLQGTEDAEKMLRSNRSDRAVPHKREVQVQALQGRQVAKNSSTMEPLYMDSMLQGMDEAQAMLNAAVPTATVPKAKPKVDGRASLLQALRAGKPLRKATHRSAPEASFDMLQGMDNAHALFSAAPVVTNTAKQPKKATVSLIDQLKARIQLRKAAPVMRGAAAPRQAAFDMLQGMEDAQAMLSKSGGMAAMAGMGGAAHSQPLDMLQGMANMSNVEEMVKYFAPGNAMPKQPPPPPPVPPAPPSPPSPKQRFGIEARADRRRSLVFMPTNEEMMVKKKVKKVVLSDSETETGTESASTQPLFQKTSTASPPGMGVDARSDSMASLVWAPPNEESLRAHNVQVAESPEPARFGIDARSDRARSMSIGSLIEERIGVDARSDGALSMSIGFDVEDRIGVDARSDGRSSMSSGFTDEEEKLRTVTAGGTLQFKANNASTVKVLTSEKEVLRCLRKVLEASNSVVVELAAALWRAVQRCGKSSTNENELRATLEGYSRRGVAHGEIVLAEGLDSSVRSAVGNTRDADRGTADLMLHTRRALKAGDSSTAKWCVRVWMSANTTAKRRKILSSNICAAMKGKKPQEEPEVMALWRMLCLHWPSFAEEHLLPEARHANLTFLLGTARTISTSRETATAGQAQQLAVQWKETKEWAQRVVHEIGDDWVVERFVDAIASLVGQRRYVPQALLNLAFLAGEDKMKKACEKQWREVLDIETVNTSPLSWTWFKMMFGETNPLGIHVLGSNSGGGGGGGKKGQRVFDLQSRIAQEENSKKADWLEAQMKKMIEGHAAEEKGYEELQNFSFAHPKFPDKGWCRQDLIPHGLQFMIDEAQLYYMTLFADLRRYNPLKICDFQVYLSRLIHRGHVMQPFFEKLMMREFGGAPGRDISFGPVKDAARVRVKAEADHSNDPFPTSAQVIDIIRCAITFDRVAQLTRFLQECAYRSANSSEPQGFQLIRVSNGFAKLKAKGKKFPKRYCDVKMTAIITGAHPTTRETIAMLAEVQLLLKPVVAFKKRQHELYEVIRLAGLMDAASQEYQAREGGVEALVKGSDGSVKSIAPIVVKFAQQVRDEETRQEIRERLASSGASDHELNFWI